MKPKSLLTIALVFCAWTTVHCTGEECSASKTIVSDRDSDCIEDTSDNCFDIYNPNQEDADEDEIGDACETTATFQTRGVSYNIAGYYEAEAVDCPEFSSLDITKHQEFLAATLDDASELSGKILSQNQYTDITAIFENANWSCLMSYNALEATHRLSCQNKSSNITCEVAGTRLTTRTESP